MHKYKIADLVFEAKTIYQYSHEFCSQYKYEGDLPADFCLEIEQKDILAEKSKTDQPFPDFYLETLALFRKFCDKALELSQTIVFHSSAIMVDGQAFLFTAPSGTGKSTHTRLWRQLLGDKVVIINDDKPMIRYIDGDFYVYGTPWNGKHKLDTNCRAKIKAICKLERSEDNRIEKCPVSQILITVLNQTVRPTDLSKMDKLLSIIERLLSSVNLYKLGCNISVEAAKLAYTQMTKGDE